ncbi:hypothetical protein [Gordonia sp. NPDC003950]
MLRAPEDEPDAAPRSAPGLAQLPDLLTAAADAGVRVDLTVEGEPIELVLGTDRQRGGGCADPGIGLRSCWHAGTRTVGGRGTAGRSVAGQRRSYVRPSGF